MHYFVTHYPQTTSHTLKLETLGTMMVLGRCCTTLLATCFELGSHTDNVSHSLYINGETVLTERNFGNFQILMLVIAEI